MSFLSSPPEHFYFVVHRFNRDLMKHILVSLYIVAVSDVFAPLTFLLYSPSIHQRKRGERVMEVTSECDSSFLHHSPSPSLFSLLTLSSASLDPPQQFLFLASSLNLRFCAFLIVMHFIWSPHHALFVHLFCLFISSCLFLSIFILLLLLFLLVLLLFNLNRASVGFYRHYTLYIERGRRSKLHTDTHRVKSGREDKSRRDGESDGDELKSIMTEPNPQTWTWY